MNRYRFSIWLAVVAMTFGIAGVADAQRRSDRDIRDAVRSLNSRLDDFEQNARYQMQSSSTERSTIADLARNVRSLRDSVREFENNFDRRRENRDDVNRIVDAARRVNEFLRAHPQNRSIEDDWSGVSQQIERLGANYGITPNWNTTDDADWPRDAPVPIRANTLSVGLSGTYELDSARSENTDDIVANTTLGTDQREDLKDKLEAPGQIAIDIRGVDVTLASSKASAVTFTADGRDKTEQSPN